jgi:cytochrome c553
MPLGIRHLSLLAGLAALPLPAAAEAAPGQAVDLLEARCFKCHSHATGKNKGGLVMDSRAGLLTGGDDGAALIPGDPDRSRILRHILSTDPEVMMPPKGDRLTPAEVKLLQDWIRAGASWPASRTPAAGANRYLPGTIGAQERAWWAYQPVKRVEPPAGAASNAIDRFIEARRSQAGLTPAPAAERATLIRRVTFDVTGLPPTPAEVEAFVADLDPSAYEKLVDRLLASPAYGERQARAWLDLVRYADSDGFRIDDFRPTAWRYRDYVIAAYNTNKPYDRFVQEQLAGDELFPGDPAALTATGYLRHWIYEYNNRDARGQWETILNDLTDTTGDVFLGAGMQCARCHDHKFDPILQRDYFALRGFFANVLPVEDRAAWTPREAAEHAQKQTLWEKRTAETRAALAQLEQKYRDKAEKEAVGRFPDDVQAMIRAPAADRSPLETQVAALAWRQVDYEFNRLDNSIKGEDSVKHADLRRKLAEADALKPPPPPWVLAVTETGPVGLDVAIPKKGTVVPPAFLSVLSATVPAPPARITPPADGRTTGRRSALARWLTEPSNPFTARLAMNRLWQQYFRRGLAPNASDFGRLGEPPSHPELLDWLAAEFMAKGWDQKAMHRLILTSATYRQSSRHPDPRTGNLKDPQNTLLWCFQPQRLEAEEILDALFAATGELKLDRRDGPGQVHGEPIRSIFTRVMRNNRDPLADVFDAPQWFASAASRDVTTTPIQSLLLLNSPFMLKRGEALADRLRKELPGDEAGQIRRLYRLLFAREPSPAEATRARAFLAEIREQKPAAQALATATVEFTPEKVPFRDGQGLRLDPGNTNLLTADRTTHLDLPNGFTIEATIVPRSVSDSGAVRAIAAQGVKSTKEGSWQFGITGQKSRRAPMVLVLQCHGQLADGKFGEAVYFSNLRLTMHKPYYVAAALTFAKDGRPGNVAFTLKDLANDDEPLLHDQVAGQLARLDTGTHPLHLGGKHAEPEGSFHGVIDDIRLSAGALPDPRLLYASEEAQASTLGFWRFENKSGLMKDSSGQGRDLSVATGKQATVKDADRAPLAALCHALLNSSEFLYVE